MLVLFDGGVPIQKDLCTFLVVRFAGVSSHGGALSVSVESDRLDSKDLLGQRIGIVAF